MTYASADDPTFTMTCSGDQTAKYSPGMRIKLTQTTVKYFIITAVSYSAPNTTITLYGGTDYDLANVAITSPYYSVVKAPVGFPLDSDKWSVTISDTTLRSQASPGAGTWYNLGTLSISIPIGAWVVSYQASVQANRGSAGVNDLYTALSTTNNGATDAALKTYSVGGNLTAFTAEVFREKPLTLAAKTTYYLNEMIETAGASTLYLRSDNSTTLIVAVCAYL